MQQETSQQHADRLLAEDKERRAALRREPLLSLTVREEAASLFTREDAPAMLAKASAAFPEYLLIIEDRDAASAVRTEGMRVQRWLRI